MIKLATVSPCYNEEEVLRQSVKRLTALFDKMIQEKLISPDSMMVFVNDGSRDRTWEIIQEQYHENKYVRGINLARNVGHQNAIMAGMMTARAWADAVVTLLGFRLIIKEPTWVHVKCYMSILIIRPI